MSDITNCFTLEQKSGEGSAEIRAGFQIMYHGGRSAERPFALRFKQGHFGWNIGVCADLCPTNDYCDSILHEADIGLATERVHPAESTYELRRRDVSDDVTLIYVNCSSGMKFSPNGPCRPYFDRDARHNPVDTWVGADAFNQRSLIQMTGDWRDPSKKQIFRLLLGEKIVFIDSLQVVSLIEARHAGECPLVQPATVHEVTEYILQQVKTRGVLSSGELHHKTLRWCERALRQLGSRADVYALAQQASFAKQAY